MRHGSRPETSSVPWPRPAARSSWRRASGFLDEIAADGTVVAELAAQSASAPGDPAPDYRLGLTSAAGAAWSVDESAVVRRIGPGAGGLTALQARWVHTFTEPPFSGAGFPATVGEFQDRAVLMDAGGAVYLVDPTDRRSRAHRRRPREPGRGGHRRGRRRQPGVHDPRRCTAGRGPAERQRAMERRADRHRAQPAGRRG